VGSGSTNQRGNVEEDRERIEGLMSRHGFGEEARAAYRLGLAREAFGAFLDEESGGAVDATREALFVDKHFDVLDYHLSSRVMKRARLGG
jgi:hypothetical protein